jgi:hypothetical protein
VASADQNETPGPKHVSIVAGAAAGVTELRRLLELIELQGWTFDISLTPEVKSHIFKNDDEKFDQFLMELQAEVYRVNDALRPEPIDHELLSVNIDWDDSVRPPLADAVIYWPMTAKSINELAAGTAEGLANSRVKANFAASRSSLIAGTPNTPVFLGVIMNEVDINDGVTPSSMRLVSRRGAFVDYVGNHTKRSGPELAGAVPYGRPVAWLARLWNQEPVIPTTTEWITVADQSGELHAVERLRHGRPAMEIDADELGEDFEHLNRYPSSAAAFMVAGFENSRGEDLIRAGFAPGWGKELPESHPGVYL